MTAALAVGAGFALAANAADENFCKDYARAAVNQVRSAEKHERCEHHLRNEGERWTRNYRAHYDWCRGVRREAAWEERNARKYALERCARR